jgi:sugar/nucleoside kinase (ribokinase family)
MNYDLFGVENPLIDLLSQVPDAFLERMELERNRTYLVELERHHALLEALEGTRIIPEPGGSCANTLLGVAQLGGTAAYCGKVGADEYGRVYIEKLQAAGVTSFVQANGNHLTGSTIILVTPDAARTMNTYLGACQELTAADLPLEQLRQARMLYITGYLWDTPGQQEAARTALAAAGEAGALVAMSLADPFCVNRHAEDFRTILQQHVGLVFANEEEALALTGAGDAKEALAILREWCGGVVITLGAEGALVCEDGETAHAEAFPVKPVDTTGAGDAFAAGYLYGRITGASLLQRGRLGGYFASRVILRMGPRLEGDVRAQLAPVLDDPRE